MMPEITPDRIRRAYQTAKTALLNEMVSEPVAADDPVQKLLDVPVTEFRHWVGELSTSALSTATAIMALEQMRRQYVVAGREVPAEWLSLIRGGIEWLVAHQNEDGGWGDTVKSVSNISTTMLCRAVLHTVQSSPVALRQESRTRNDSANGPCTSSAASNVNGATAFVSRSDTATLAQAYIDRAGGVPALIARYGKDHTFSVPILTHCALAGLVEWREVMTLPFELACIPAKFYAAVRLPVVSYALPALIAIGQVRFHFKPSRNPLRRWLQRWAKPVSLRVLERIQPTNGGFLEATPLTSFVTMSLAAMGLHDHPVAQKGIEFIVKSARRVGWDQRSAGPPSDESGGPALEASLSHPTASWPIDTNLATWVTTLAINALSDDVPLEARPGLRAWLLRQQYRVVHPYTNAASGGWSWTDLPGGVPDADDTPGAMLALIRLSRKPFIHQGSPAKELRPKTARLASRDDQPATQSNHHQAILDASNATKASGDSKCERPLYSVNAHPFLSGALELASQWLGELQNRDFGWPTFCRGWGTLPFDRSSPDITAHNICALGECLRSLWRTEDASSEEVQDIIAKQHRVLKKMLRGARFLLRTQRPDGSWLPLWFGNQHAPNDENPTYGTAKVLAAFQALGRMSDESAVRGVRWLVENQNPDGGWGAGPGTPSSVEETALALEALQGSRDAQRSHHAPRDEPSAESAWNEDRASISETKRPGRSARHAERDGYVDGTETAVTAGLSWLIPRVEDGRFREPAPIGFYFAKLWYFERLYPLIFTVAALRRGVEVCENDTKPLP